ncbi:diguanylate cyclase (GGDEF) domain-containing protein [Rheinheimera sp. A13L]|uniref:bifunctional diguanylate cyclase/phosphodiesterase n=1 Tax=Rheinheimera sp. A13L TaxID=506534 RepID=UPI0002125174|nr:diguanylate cyclase [Rheinheimera sp. A13L]EGM79609.1 diguanylate cyclase (GGDEF) domain-containing protein [Rheinheimera sp. A13L]
MKDITTLDKAQHLVVSQLRRLRKLAAGYKQAYIIQGALLKLSELASCIKDMREFYPAIHRLLNQQLKADNFYVVLCDQDQQFLLEYFADEKDQHILLDAPSDAFASGLTGYVARTKQALLCDQDDYRRLVESGDITAQGTACQYWLGVPLCRGEKVIGVMAIQSYDPQCHYNQHDLALISNIAIHTVTAIDRVRSRELLEQTVRERTQQLQTINQSLQKEIRERTNAEQLQSALYKISEMTARSTDMMSFYHEVYQILSELMKADNCYIALLNEAGDRLRFPFYLDQYTPTPTERALQSGLTEYVIRSGEAKLISQTQLLDLVKTGVVDRVKSSFGHYAMPTSWLGAPLMVGDQVLGVIALQCYDNTYSYSDQELNLLRFVSQHIAVAISRKLNTEQQKQQHEELEKRIFERTRELRQTNLFLRLQVEERKKAEEKLFHEANHDALTGLANRQMFLMQLRQRFSYRNREANPRFALLFIDLDRFKLINDTLGHHIGDLFLIEVSQRLQQTVREHDLVARLGGDEFVILLGQIQSDLDAEEVAERLIESLRQPMILEGQQVCSGASLGIACYQAEYQNADELLRDADAAMYQAKSFGRNRFVIFNDSMRQQMLQELGQEQALQQAVAQQQFAPAFRPLLQGEAQVLGYQVLLDWQQGDAEQKAELSRQATQAGLMPDIELELVRQLCQKNAGATVFSITLTNGHLNNTVLFDKLCNVLRHSVLPLHQLCIGFNEADLLRLTSTQLANLHQLKRLGIRLLLDQFAAEVAALGLLVQYPFDFVVLDTAFSRSLQRSDQRKQLLQVLLSLAQTHKYRLVAAVAENDESRAYLTQLGCCYFADSSPVSENQSGLFQQLA